MTNCTCPTARLRDCTYVEAMRNVFIQQLCPVHGNYTHPRDVYRKDDNLDMKEDEG